MSRGGRLAAIIAVVLVVLVAVGAWVLWPRGTTEVTEEQAVESFRENSSSTTEPVAASAVPAPGVYTYAATGSETVKLGPLPAETRTFPATVTGVVADVADDCFTWTTNFFAEHTEDTRYCVADGALSLAEHVKHQTIGALSPTATMTCDPAVLLASDATGNDLACTLTLSGGPASVTANLAGTATAGPPEDLDVGGEQVATTPVEITYTVTGDLSGTWSETVWFAGDHLPVKVVRDLDLSGPATLTEHSELSLTSLEPST